MMKKLLFACLMLFSGSIYSQVLIHAHNDYEKPEPLFNALRNEAFTIEADVYLVNGKLLVAHDRVDIDSGRSLSSLYLDPIDSLFKLNGNRISKNPAYRPTLAIDIKSEGEKCIHAIIALIKTRPGTFDRTVNKNAVQVFISGDRGEIAKWSTYPRYIMFDGRPSENYNTSTLNKVITISESYGRYYQQGQLRKDSLIAMIRRSHQQNKLVRIWGAPDFPETWKLFRSLGIDIINTDKVRACREFLQSYSNK